jgi:rhodanese-related sulfurtransferase
MVNAVVPLQAPNPFANRRSIETLLADARERLIRLSPREAHEAVSEGAVLVDIRPGVNRELEGIIPGALILHRNVLEWRLDPTSDARIRQADYDLHVIVFCNEGYTSSLAAAALQDLGVHRATDLVGGYRAWRAAGLPVAGSRID